MKPNDIIDRFAGLTHSPRGKYAEKQDIYEELMNRLPENDKPKADNPVIGRRRRWTTAASVALILGIGVAIASVVTFRSELLPEFFPSEQVEESAVGGHSANTLVFDNVPLREIAGSLSETYGVKIMIEDTDLAEYCITATFSTDESLDEILEILAEVGEFDYKKEDGRIVLF